MRRSLGISLVEYVGRDGICGVEQDVHDLVGCVAMSRHGAGEGKRPPRPIFSARPIDQMAERIQVAAIEVSRGEEPLDPRRTLSGRLQRTEEVA